MIALLVCATLSAEGHFGILAGVNNSTLSLSDFKTGGQYSFAGGVTYNLPLGYGFAFQPELLYTVKGTKWTEEGTDNNYRVSYLELPLQVQWGLDLIVLKPYLFMEPFVGLALAGRYNDQSFAVSSFNMDMKEMRSRFEYGVGAGAGLLIGNRIQIAAKYYWNLEDFNYKYEGAWTLDGKKTPAHRGFNILVGFLF